MRLIVTSSAAQVVEIISRRACHSWICGPSRGTKTTRIHVFACRFKHLFASNVAIATGRFKLRFKPVQKNSTNAEVKGIYPRDFSNCKCSDNHTDHNNRQPMTPRKFDYFLRSIQSILQFVNRINLHDNQQFYLIKFRIAQILLKIYKLYGAIPGFFQYSSQNNNTIGTTV